MKALREFVLPIGVIVAWSAAAVGLLAPRPTERLPVLRATEVRVIAEPPPCGACPPCAMAAKAPPPAPLAQPPKTQGTQWRRLRRVVLAQPNSFEP
jgi:hypothetical protein